MLRVGEGSWELGSVCVRAWGGGRGAEGAD